MNRISSRLVQTLLIGAFLSSLITAPVKAQTVTLNTLTPKQGQTIQVVVTVPDAESAPEVTFNKKKYVTFPVSDNGEQKFQALIAVPALLKPGEYKLSAAGVEKSIKVMAGGFGVQRLTLPKSKDNFNASPGEVEAVQAAKKTLSPERMWKGNFQIPTAGRQSTGFGLRRIVNGRLLSDYFHSGLDYAAGTGTPVKATQAGKIVIAKTGWKLHGNTVAIDHGQGVISFYIHLSKVLVKEGDMVKAGEVIGKVGATGRASGPHLHFSVYVNEDATNPLDWYKNSFSKAAGAATADNGKSI